MYAMHPMFERIFGLEGFEAVEFWFILFVVFLASGFALDYVLKGAGYGPVINGAIVLLSGFAGAYAHYNYFVRDPYFLYQPYVTIGFVSGLICLILLFGAFLRNRLT